jgi:membrane-associated phospholipid phosphatase
MATLPTGFDLWLANKLASLMPLHPQLDVGVQDAIRVNVLGGLWFGLVLFIWWNQSGRKGERKIQLRVLTILAGSVLAILFTLLAGTVISWPPPVHYPGLDGLYLGYLGPNPNSNSFPSQSVALYASIAAGIYSLQKAVGWVLWIMVAVFVAIPRMFVGGHFISDILAGLIMGLAGYWISRYLLESRLTSKVEQILNQTPLLQLLREAVFFIWMMQVSTEFKGVVWLKEVLESILGRSY